MPRESLSKSEVYIQKNFAQEDADLIRVREALLMDNKFGINVSSSEGKLLQFFVGLISAKTIVEIGTLYGYSTLWMAKALPADGRLYAIERDAHNFARASELIAKSDVTNRIQLIHGDAREEVAKLKIAPDIVFIDADKLNYRHYLDWAMQNVRIGGLVIGDNTFLFGHMTGEDRGERASRAAIESMSYFNTTLAKAPNFRAIMVPTHEGMTLAQKLA